MNSILVVNANTDHLVALSSLLTNNGYCVIVKSDGASALATFGQGADIDLVISNYVLPDMNGLNFFGSLKATEGAHPPLILLSDRVDVMTYLTALRHGVFEFLFSPVNYRELLRIVQVAIRQSKGFPERNDREAGSQTIFQGDPAAAAYQLSD